MTNVFIMCQGLQSRLPKLATRKQLLKVGGRPIIVRTIGQVRQHELEPIVVGWPDMSEVVEEKYACELLTLRYAGLCILDGISATEPWWVDGRNLFLLGDVVYSNAAIRKILSNQDDVMFFGTPDLAVDKGELFAYSVRRALLNETCELLMRVPCRKVISKKGQAGHLRNLLWMWMKYYGLRADSPFEYAKQLLTPIDDWTNDIDTQQDVEFLLPVLDEHVRQERDRATG